MEGPGDTYFLAEDFTRPCARGYDLSQLTDQFARYSSAAEAGGKDVLFLVASDKGAILDGRLSGRANVAASCSREARPALRAALDSTGVSFDLAPTLIAAEDRDPGRWYYEHDSHWTFDAGGLVAEQIVNHFEPGLFDPTQLGTIDRSLPIRGDIYARMGILKLRDQPDPVQSSLRSTVTTTRSEVQIGGTRTVRTYQSSGEGGVIAGRTVVVHDSMMNFAERQVASYFEHIDFIHWDDLGLADFGARFAAADRVVMMRVERDVHETMLGILLKPSIAEQIESAFRTERDTDLGLELQNVADALRRFTQDTGTFANSYQSLLEDSGVEGWSGPYLSGDVFANGDHPRYGAWGAVPSADSGGVTDCTTLPDPPCATWVSLVDVPPVLFDELDAEFDAGDGSALGRVRRDEATEELYFYTFDLN